MGKLGRLINGPSSLLANLSMVVVTIMMVHVVADVSMKYLFNSPIHGTLEIVAAYYMVAVVFLPLAHATRHGGQIIVELFTRGMSVRNVRRLDGAVGVLGAAYLAMFTWQTFNEAVRRTRGGEMWETAEDLVAVWPSRWLLPLGFAIASLYLLHRAIEDLRGAGAASETTR